VFGVDDLLLGFWAGSRLLKDLVNFAQSFVFGLLFFDAMVNTILSLTKDSIRNIFLSFDIEISLLHVEVLLEGFILIFDLLDKFRIVFATLIVWSLSIVVVPAHCLE
jgi:hypothetical protein